MGSESSAYCHGSHSTYGSFEITSVLGKYRILCKKQDPHFSWFAQIYNDNGLNKEELEVKKQQYVIHTRVGIALGLPTVSNLFDFVQKIQKLLINNCTILEYWSPDRNTQPNDPK
jgi:hypothetical protein